MGIAVIGRLGTRCQDRTQQQHRRQDDDDQARQDPNTSMHRVIDDARSAQQAGRYQESAYGKKDNYSEAAEIHVSGAIVQKGVFLEIGILNLPGVVQQYDDRSDKSHVVESRPPKGGQNQTFHGRSCSRP